MAVRLDGHSVPYVTRTTEQKGQHNSSASLLSHSLEVLKGPLPAKGSSSIDFRSKAQVPRKSPTRERRTLQGMFHDLQPAALHSTELWSPGSITYLQLHQGSANFSKKPESFAGHSVLRQLFRAAVVVQKQPLIILICKQVGVPGFQ